MSDLPLNFAKVTGSLWRGARPYPDDRPTDIYLRKLKEIGIERIISLDSEVGNRIASACKKLGLDQTIVNLRDGNDFFHVDIVKELVPHFTDKPTYVHCYHGKDRTSMAIAMFRLYSGWTLKQALGEAVSFYMGEGLSPSVKKSYYEAVEEYAQELEDINLNDDVASLSREMTSASNPGMNNPQISNPDFRGSGPMVDGHFPTIQRSTFSSSRVYCRNKAKSGPTIWFTRKPKGYGTLYSAIIPVDIKILEGNKTSKEMLLMDADACKFDGKYKVLSLDVLEDIKKEEDVNDLDLGNLDVGLHDNYSMGVGSFENSQGVMGGIGGGAAGTVLIPSSSGFGI